MNVLTSKADLLPPEIVSLEGAGGDAVSGGPRLNVGLTVGLVSFSNILFMSLTVSPREKYSSSTSLAVLTRSRLAPVILRLTSLTSGIFQQQHST